MSVRSNMFAPIPALCFLLVISVNAESVLRVEASGTYRIVGSELKQNRQEPPAGKRRSVHEYSPEDVLPEAEENQNSRVAKSQAQRRRARSKSPGATTNKVTPPQKATPIPTPLRSVQPAAVTFTSPTPKAINIPAPTRSPALRRKVEDSRSEKLLVSISLFLLVLAGLVFFITKLIRQRRADKEATESTASEHRSSDPIGQLFGSGKKAVVDKPINPSGR
jgi:hypothetical protein